jgi:hypothetical protein
MKASFSKEILATLIALFQSTAMFPVGPGDTFLDFYIISAGSVNNWLHNPRNLLKSRKFSDERTDSNASLPKHLVRGVQQTLKHENPTLRQFQNVSRLQRGSRSRKVRILPQEYLEYFED